MKTVGIIGMGVMGGSFAGRLKQLGYRVYGFDLNGHSLKRAKEKGWIDEGFADFSHGLADCELLIFCIYPTLLKEWIEKNQNHFAPRTLILEISGVKRAVMEPVQNILRKDCELMSIHPMCGRESKGIEYANPVIFDQANFILIPDDRNSASTIVKVSSLAKDLGCKNISVLTPEEHDKMIGFLSQLTHVIAVTLMDTHENEHLVEYTGDSFRDLTRIASINEDMWCELFLLNKDILLDEIRQFRDTLDEFTQALEQSDEKKMKDMMVLSTKRRHKFD
ncbi:prephenate dehydrogenase [Allobaculum stercoricanis]|uniref:prephenate dehydrogenase n=1 Tax=Allobaculum stercoricanis TaxID=174709 RepID=UPI002942BB5E|nr:prephenate dehydrogenase [Allobaculum stercoricanis]